MTSLPFEDLPEKPVEPGYFDEFWMMYPRKIGKKDARKAFAKALKRAAPGTIMDGVESYQANKPSYADWMHPTTFLNGDHWEDEYDTIDALKAGIVGGAFHGESLEAIAAIVKRAGTTWARHRYPRDVLEQCVAAGLITESEKDAAL